MKPIYSDWTQRPLCREFHLNLTPPQLVEMALMRKEGLLASNGAFVVRTGKFTGRSPKDKFFVEEPSSVDKIWWGTVNQKLNEESFDKLYARIVDHFADRELFVQDLYGGADSRYTLPVRVYTEFAWHNLFARQLLVRPEFHRLQADKGFPPSPFGDKGFTIIAAPHCPAHPENDGVNSETYIVIHLGRRMVLIGGTEYAGEIKKSVFTLLNYLLPRQGILPMHCSANIGRAKQDTALFFGLSGTGKTTLSADPNRDLIGDDEHGWTDEGVFNFEGGCYAKCIRLQQVAEPQIWDAIRFGSVLENVVMEEGSRELDYNDASLTENTRVAYPINYIPNARIPGVGDHPTNVVFLTADAFGTLPPISRLSPQQARYHFLNGYTAKVAGTERGLGNEPQATFSACFGQPFLPLPPTVYADMLMERIRKHNVTVWLVNTGWTGGVFGVGQRMPLKYTRLMLESALTGDLNNVSFEVEPTFGLSIPTAIEGVPSTLLRPRENWKNPEAYDIQAEKLNKLFAENYQRFC